MKTMKEELESGRSQRTMVAETRQTSLISTPSGQGNGWDVQDIRRCFAR
jgi:hypothetical protein